MTLQCGWCVAGRLVPGPLLPDVHHGRRHDLAPRRQGVRQDRLLRRAPVHQVGGRDLQFGHYITFGAFQYYYYALNDGCCCGCFPKVPM